MRASTKAATSTRRTSPRRAYTDAGVSPTPAARSDWMLCALALMSYTQLNEANQLAFTGDPSNPVQVTVHPTPTTAHDLAECDQIAAGLLTAHGAQPVLGEDGLGLQTAALGGVAHGVGTQRMADDGTGVVDTDLKFLDYETCTPATTPPSPPHQQPTPASPSPRSPCAWQTTSRNPGRGAPTGRDQQRALVLLLSQSRRSRGGPRPLRRLPEGAYRLGLAMCARPARHGRLLEPAEGRSACRSPSETPSLPRRRIASQPQ